MTSALIKWYDTNLRSPKDLVSDNVHWRSFNPVRNKNIFNLSMFITKWSGRKTVTGRILIQRKTMLNFKCPICDALYGNTEDILLCQFDSICELWGNLLVDLIILLKSVHT